MVLLRQAFGLLLVTFAFRAVAVELPDFTELVDTASPAVVNISTTRSADAEAGLYGQYPQLEEMPEFFRHFFGDRFQVPPRGQGAPHGRPQVQSTGSGFIVSHDGYVLTNNHVVEGAGEIFVRLADRRELKAELIGADQQSDLAVLKLDAGDLPIVKIGNSNKLKVGEWVVAIGAPFGFDYSVTAGIVSAKGRSLPNESYVPFIQTDVAINPGNSGGPLFNLDGEVVGINSQIYTRSGGFMGLSFAIPIDVAMEVVEQLKTNGSVSRGWLGVLIQEVSKELAESFQLDKPRGALVAQILPDSPAQDSDLQVGDVIIEYNGKSINLSSDLPHLVGRTAPGKEVDLKVIRQGKIKTVTLEIGRLPGENQAASSDKGSKAPSIANTLNLQVRDLTADEKSQVGVNNGILVTDLSDGSAAEAGIRPGDVISSINNEAVTSVKQFKTLVEDLPRDKALPVLIIREGSPVFVVIKIRD
ncbi:MAG: DegQ family serine endoprotease [Hahellaceae bacterium]|jgi:serine protease Do|nr:DegQ family serine endoprotease [Hahellaceae bacterium]